VIQCTSTPDGGYVLTRDGRKLCSAVAPKKEAQEWLDRQNTMWTKTQSVVVLGLGAGHHVRALLQRSEARVLVVDPLDDTWTLPQFDDLRSHPRLTFLRASSVDALKANDDLQKILLNSYVVLTHAPSFFNHQALLHEIHETLSARNWRSLQWIWSLRQLPPLDPVPRIDAHGPPLTVHDLASTAFARNADHEERLLILSLRELVK
jgi:hypothetical protein